MRINYDSAKGVASSFRKGLFGLMAAAVVAYSAEPMLQISHTTIQTSRGPKPGVHVMWGDSAYVTNNIVSTNGTTITTNSVVERVMSHKTDTNIIYTLQARTNLSDGRWNDVYEVRGNGSHLSRKEVSGEKSQFYRVVTSPAAP